MYKIALFYIHLILSTIKKRGSDHTASESLFYTNRFFLQLILLKKAINNPTYKKNYGFIQSQFFMYYPIQWRPQDTGCIAPLYDNDTLDTHQLSGHTSLRPDAVKSNKLTTDQMYILWLIRANH